MKKIESDCDIECYLMGKNEPLEFEDNKNLITLELRPDKFYIFPNGSSDNKPSLAISMDGRGSLRVIGQISLEMLRPVIDELLNQERMNNEQTTI